MKESRRRRRVTAARRGEIPPLPRRTHRLPVPREERRCRRASKSTLDAPRTGCCSREVSSSAGAVRKGAPPSFSVLSGVGRPGGGCTQWHRRYFSCAARSGLPPPPATCKPPGVDIQFPPTTRFPDVTAPPVGASDLGAEWLLGVGRPGGPEPSSRPEPSFWSGASAFPNLITSSPAQPQLVTAVLFRCPLQGWVDLSLRRVRVSSPLRDRGERTRMPPPLTCSTLPVTPGMSEHVRRRAGRQIDRRGIRACAGKLAQGHTKTQPTP